MGRVDDVGRGWRSWPAARGREILDMFASGEGCTDLERPSCSTEMCSLLRDICCSSQRFFSAFLLSFSAQALEDLSRSESMLRVLYYFLRPDDTERAAHATRSSAISS